MEISDHRNLELSLWYTVWRKILTEENIDEFPTIHQYFPRIIYMLHMDWKRLRKLYVTEKQSL